MTTLQLIDIPVVHLLAHSGLHKTTLRSKEREAEAALDVTVLPPTCLPPLLFIAIPLLLLPPASAKRGVTGCWEGAAGRAVPPSWSTCREADSGLCSL